MNPFDEKINLGPVAKTYIKKRKLIFFTVITCTVIAIVASFILKPRYKATTSFFIPYNISYDLAIENPQFGYDIEADRLLQILNSEQLIDSVSKKFNLVNYFGIDTSNFDWKNTLTEKYRRRITSDRTNTMSIVIEAETHDPYFSKEMVTYILELSQRLREKMLKTNSEQAVESFKKDYMRKLVEVDSLRNQIIRLRKENSSNPVTLVNSQILLNNGNVSGLQPDMEVELEVLSQKHINEHNRLNDLKGKYENALNILNRPVPKFYMLDYPTPLFNKTFPNTWLNISIAFLGSLFFMLTGLYIQYVVGSIKQSISTE